MNIEVEHTNPKKFKVEIAEPFPIDGIFITTSDGLNFITTSDGSKYLTTT